MHDIIQSSLTWSWTWQDAAIFAGVFLGIRFATMWLATKAFILMIPDGDVCPLCDSQTLAIERNGWWRVLGPTFRRSWCIECGWEGVLRRTDSPSLSPMSYDGVPSMANSLSQSGQLPLNSKKSS